MKFKTPSGRIKGNILKNSLIISIDKKSKMINKSALPIKLTVSNGFAEKYRIKREIKQTQNKPNSPEGLYPLIEVIEEKIILSNYHNSNKENFDNWMRAFAYEYLYEVAFDRGIRHERERRKSKNRHLTAFDLISADDVIELSHKLEISEDKLTYAVLEILAERKNGGRA